MSMKYIRRTYGVPARRGGRVKYTGDGVDECGTIRSASGGYLSIQLDGMKQACTFHPTWELQYLSANPGPPDVRDHHQETTMTK